jgi:indole-3-glycerol phosphate synthase
MRETTATPDLLATIVAAAKRITDVRAGQVSERALEKLAARRSPDADEFLRALRDGESPRVIAECKRRSPSRGILREDYHAAEHAVPRRSRC